MSTSDEKVCLKVMLTEGERFAALSVSLENEQRQLKAAIPEPETLGQEHMAHYQAMQKRKKRTA